MAKDSHDREDLMREATGYVRRVEFTIAEREEPVFCGFRECGAFSLYWKQADVLQFNVDGELRRAFWKNQMLACYKHKLHWLQKSEGRIRLGRTPLSDEESQEFLSVASSWMDEVRHIVKSQLIADVNEFPVNANVVVQVAEWLSEHDAKLNLSMHPGLGKKRPIQGN